MAMDITDRKDVEEGLRNSEEKVSKAFRESPVALTLTSATFCTNYRVGAR
jgi:hypothetical protein